MGYYVTLTDADWGIPEEKWDAAFQALVELNKRDDLKTGGRWSGGKRVEKWFAWMDTDYPEKALAEYEEKKLPHPLVWVFQELGFDWETGLDDEEFRLTYYDSKAGGEDHFLAAVAPFVRPGSYLEWRGEDGEMWRQEFDGEIYVTKEGRVVYD